MNLRKSLAKKLKKTGGFTLIEMLIVVAIIAILVAVSIPLVSSSLDKARNATDAANVRAAKSAAVMEYMINGTGTGADEFWYDADSGKAEDAVGSIKGYNQAEQNGGAAGTKCVKVSIAADGTVTTSWEDDGT